MTLLKKEERICRELGDPVGLVSSLTNQGRVLARAGRVREALPLVEEAYREAIARGLTPLAQQIEPLLREVRQAS